MKHAKMMCELPWKSGRENSSKEDLSLRLRGNSKANSPCLDGGDGRHPKEALQGCTDAESDSRTDGQTLRRAYPPTDAPNPMWDGFHFSEFAVVLRDEVIGDKSVCRTL